nr:hypothetical protein Iba_chr15aCG12590 [Ipomoea batatas]
MSLGGLTVELGDTFVRIEDFDVSLTPFATPSLTPSLLSSSITQWVPSEMAGSCDRNPKRPCPAASSAAVQGKFSQENDSCSTIHDDYENEEDLEEMELNNNIVINIILPLEDEDPVDGTELRKLVSEYLMKQPVYNARASDQGRHFNMDLAACSKHLRQPLAFTVFQQFAKTYAADSRCLPVLGAPLQTSSKTRVITSIKATCGIGTKRAVFFMFPI